MIYCCHFLGLQSQVWFLPEWWLGSKAWVFGYRPHVPSRKLISTGRIESGCQNHVEVQVSSVSWLCSALRARLSHLPPSAPADSPGICSELSPGVLPLCLLLGLSPWCSPLHLVPLTWCEAAKHDGYTRCFRSNTGWLYFPGPSLQRCLDLCASVSLSLKGANDSNNYYNEIDLILCDTPFYMLPVLLQLYDRATNMLPFYRRETEKQRI